MKIKSIFSICKVRDFPTGFILGSNNELIVKNATDLKNFKEKTNGHALIMGRKTFESLGSKALSNRKMIVISNMDVEDFKKQKDCLLARSLKGALDIAENDLKSEIAWVIGGGNIIREAMSLCDEICYSVFNYTKTYNPETKSALQFR